MKPDHTPQEAVKLMRKTNDLVWWRAGYLHDTQGGICFIESAVDNHAYEPTLRACVAKLKKEVGG